MMQVYLASLGKGDASLSLEDRAKVDALTHELLTKQKKSKPGAQQEKDGQ